MGTGGGRSEWCNRLLEVVETDGAGFLLAAEAREETDAESDSLDLSVYDALGPGCRSGVGDDADSLPQRPRLRAVHGNLARRRDDRDLVDCGKAQRDRVFFDEGGDKVVRCEKRTLASSGQARRTSGNPLGGS